MTHPSQGSRAKFWLIHCRADYGDYGGKPGQCRNVITSMAKNEDVARAQLTHLADLQGWQWTPGDESGLCTYHEPKSQFVGEWFVPSPMPTPKETQ